MGNVKNVQLNAKDFRFYEMWGDTDQANTDLATINSMDKIVLMFALTECIEL